MESNTPSSSQPHVPTHECALCMMSYPVTDFFNHLVDEHYDVFISLLATYCPDIESSLFIQLMRRFVLQQFEEEFNDYEYLLELCNAMGYHTIGISNIENVATYFTLTERCPICLDETQKEGYQTKKCRHEFCKECFRKWTNDHKSCPLCKTELEDTVK